MAAEYGQGKEAMCVEAISRSNRKIVDRIWIEQGLEWVKDYREVIVAIRKKDKVESGSKKHAHIYTSREKSIFFTDNVIVYLKHM